MTNQASEDELPENEWKETEYICKECGDEDVVSNITNDWKIFYCNNCGSQTPLSVSDIMKEATK